MQLTVLSIAYPLAPVKPGAVGGAEEILSALDEALIDTGSRSIVVAQEGSEVKGHLFSTSVPPGTITEEIQTWVQRRHQENIDRVLRSCEIDLIHMHGIDFPHYRLPKHIPILATLHLPPSWYPQEIWSDTFSHIQLQCVSRSQQALCPNDREQLPVIENGVTIEEPTAHAKRRFALVLGRICREKNIHVALDAGKKAKTPVLVGGQVFPYPDHLRYLREEVQPRLVDGNRFLGPLSPSRRRRFLQSACCLCIPSLAPETSSLVAMEAFAVGTPVIAFPSGALSEIVEHGKTGFLVNSVDEMAQAISCTSLIDPEICRRAAEQRFHRKRMVDQYLSLYKQMLLSRLSSGDFYDVAV